MKRLYATLKLFLGCSIGVFLGRCIYLYFDFKARPELYAALVSALDISGAFYGRGGCCASADDTIAQE